MANRVMAAAVVASIWIAGCAAPEGATLHQRRYLNPATGVESVAPLYPAESKRKGEEGTVHLLALIGAEGRADEVVLAKSSGFPALDDAAIEAVRQWRFRPTAQNPVPAGTWRDVPVNFVMQPR